MFVFWKVL